MSTKTFLETVKTRLGPLGWGALVVFVVTRCADALYFLTKIVLGRWLTDVDFGAIEPVLSMRAIALLPIVVLSDAMSKSISRLQEKGEEAQKNRLIVDMIKVTLIASLVTGFAVFALKPFILSRLALPAWPFTWILVGIVAFGLWEPVCLAIIRGERSYRLLNIPHVASPLIGFILTVVLVGFLYMGLAGALIARAGAWFATGILMIFLIWKRVSGQKESYSEEFKVMRRTILPVTLLVASMTVLVHFDRLFVRNFLTDESGGYGAVVTLGYIPSLLIGPIVFVVLPLASAAHAASRNLNRLYGKATLLGLGITALCTIGFVLFGRQALSLWNPNFGPFAGLLGLYGLAMGIDGIVLTIAYIETARNRYGFLWFLVVPTIAMCLGMYYFRREISLQGVVGVIVATRCVIMGGMLLHLAPRHRAENRH